MNEIILKTIKKYEIERSKYEIARTKYETEYQKEKNRVVWRKYKLKDLFIRKAPPSTNVPAKELTIYDTPFDGSIALITRAESNNGVKGFIDKEDFPTLKKGITYNDQFSLFLFHNYEFTTIKDHLSIITASKDKLQKIMEENDFVDFFMTTVLNRIFSKKIFSFSFTGTEYRFDRELILLPCIEVEKPEDCIWEEDGKFYTLAVDYISYLYLWGMMNKKQKLIENYSNRY